MTIPNCCRGTSLLALAALALTCATPTTVSAQAAGVDPEAARLLRRMSDYMGGLQRFSLDTENTLEAVLVSGQKIQFDGTTEVTVRRPNRLYAERGGDTRQNFYYDGKTLTLYNPAENYYATVPAPGTLEAMLDFARDSLDVVAPAGELLFADAYGRLMQDATSGLVVGKAIVAGVECEHLAFRGPVVDWQIWIQAGDEPLPRKYVITTKDLAGWPQFTVVVRNWNPAPGVDDARFSFVPPQGAEQVEFLPLMHTGSSR
jgi:hypothetical protein